MGAQNGDLMKRNCKHYALIIGAVLVALMIVSCERKAIKDIKLEPGRYSQQPVVVSGKVVRSFSVAGKGAYEIDDGTGRLWIVAEKSVPHEGARVTAKGTIRDAYDLSAFVKLPGVSSVMVMIESTHQTR
jgi:hypothetical protein